VQNLVKSLSNAVNRYDVRRPTGAPEKAVAPASASQAAPDLPAQPVLHPEILGTMGEEIAHNLTQALEMIVELASQPRGSAQTLAKTHFLIDRMRRKAMSMQQISRLAQNRVRQSHEKLTLSEVVQHVLEDRKVEHAASSLVIDTRYKKVEIIVDPGLLMSLISTALDWVTEFGTVVRISTTMKNWPQHGQLTFSSAQGVRTQEDIDRKSNVNQSIAWHLLQQTAQAMGVGLVINETVNERGMTIEFPRTVVALEGMTIMEMETGHSVMGANSSFGSVNSNFIAGHQVLVISNDYRMFVQIREICKSLSLRCEHAATVNDAERQCEQAVPHLIVCEEAMMDDDFNALLDDLQRHSPGFPTILVSDESYGFELSDWSGNNKSRVARNQIQEELPTALTIELSRSI
jgi:hypothetical protein